MQDGYTVGVLDPQDADGVSAARVLVQASLHLWYADRGLDPGRPRPQDAALLVDLAGPRRRSLVALARDDHGSPVGVCVLLPDGPTTFLRSGFVLPGHRGRGVGTALVAALLSVAADRGVQVVTAASGQDSHLPALLARLGVHAVEVDGPGRVRFRLPTPHLPAVRTT